MNFIYSLKIVHYYTNNEVYVCYYDGYVKIIVDRCDFNLTIIILNIHKLLQLKRDLNI